MLHFFWPTLNYAYCNERINDNPDMSYRDRAIEPRKEHLLRDGDIELGIEGVFTAVLYVHHDIGIAAPTRVQRRSRPGDQRRWWSWWWLQRWWKRLRWWPTVFAYLLAFNILPPPPPPPPTTHLPNPTPNVRPALRAYAQTVFLPLTYNGYYCATLRT